MLFAERAAAQYYTWGSDAPQKWSTVRTPDVRMIYPDTVGGIARRTLFYVRTVQPTIGYGFHHGPMRIPFVMHPENFQSNGLVMYLPKRVEFLTSPSIESYSMPWYKQLVAHEYRHAVQYNNLDRGVIRVLSYVLGQQGSTIGLLCMPIWVMEGDATMSETMSSTFGRALQPSFTMGFRAMEGVGYDRRGRLRHNTDKWFCGSYIDHVPDHYELGYQICAYAWNRYGENIWDKVARFGSHNPYMLATTSIALKKYYRTNVNELFRGTFDALDTLWSSLPAVDDRSRPLVELPDRNYTVWQWPQIMDDGSVVAVKSDYSQPTRIVRLDPATGEERTLAYTGSISTRPAVDGGRVWWTEYRRSTLFEQRVNSQLCYMDLDGKRPKTVRKMRRVLYPTPAGDDFAWVDYDPSGRFSVVVRRADGDKERIAADGYAELHGLAWDSRTQALYTLVTDDDGMHIARVGSSGLTAATKPAYVTLSDLSAAEGKLYFGSIASGRDQVHCLDLASGREYRISDAEYGAFDVSARGDSVVMTTYSRRGYAPAVQSASEGELVEVVPRCVPENVVNMPLGRWPVPNLDTVRFTAADSVEQHRNYRTRRYAKLPNLANVHSWMPVAMNPFNAVDEHAVDLNLGVTFLSQNLLSNTEAYASYGWNRGEGSMFNFGLRYLGLGVHFDLSAAYGGNQMFYRLAQYDEETQKPVYQTTPSPDPYYSVGLSATLPFNFSGGRHNRQLSVRAGWNFSNGMVANLSSIVWEEGKISNIQRIGFHEGLHKVDMGIGFSDHVTLARRDFAPRWGYTFQASYIFNPTNGEFSDLFSVYGQGYLPGVAPHHSLRLAATYQNSIGGYKFPDGYAPLSFRSTRLIPHGFSSSDIQANSYTAFSAAYQMPVWYPDGGIGSILYFKRVRLGVGGDYAQFRDVTLSGMGWRRIWSAGVDLVLDVNAFRQPASATSSVTLSFWRPSSGGLWFSASVGLPF